MAFEDGVNGVETVEVKENGDISTDETPAPTKKFDIPLASLKEINVTDYMKQSLDKVAQSEGFNNYDFNVVHGSAVGDGFVGLVFKVIIQEKDSDKKLTLILKTPPENQARRVDFGSMALFKREVHMYNVVLPAFVEFQKEKHIKESEGFYDFPKCYFAEYDEEKDDAIILMEDLKQREFKMWDKFTPTNFEHAKLIVTALGRLHALSFAMKAQKPEIFDEFKKLEDFLSTRFQDPNMDAMMNASFQRAAATLDEGDTKKKERVMKLANNMGQLLKELVNPENAEPYAVVTHGDCWSNNFMYQYKRGFPDKIILLDWQVSRYCSPVLDLVYFFFVCTDTAMRAKHYDELLGAYHRSLKDLLDHLGGDTMTQFPFTALLRQLKKFGKFGIIMGTFLIPMLTIKNEDLPDMDFMAENMKNDDPEFQAEMMKRFGSTTDAYGPRMRGSLLDSMKYGYF